MRTNILYAHPFHAEVILLMLLKSKLYVQKNHVSDKSYIKEVLCLSLNNIFFVEEI